MAGVSLSGDKRSPPPYLDSSWDQEKFISKKFTTFPRYFNGATPQTEVYSSRRETKPVIRRINFGVRNISSRPFAELAKRKRKGIVKKGDYY
jgi:hypothetical protein